MKKEFPAETGEAQALTGRSTPLRDLIVQAGLEVLDRDGLGLRADTITYAKVFGYIEEEHGIRITRGSVHERIWSSQDDFRLEVLTAAADHESPFDSGRRITSTLLDSLRLVHDLGLDPTERVRTFTRRAGTPLLDAYLRSEDYRRFQATKEAARSSHDDHAATVLRDVVRKQVQEAQRRRNRRYDFLFKTLGLRAKADHRLGYERTTDLYLSLLHLLVSGAHLDHWAGFTGLTSKVETDLAVADDGPPWTCGSFGILACIELLFEPDPAHRPQPLPETAADWGEAPPRVDPASAPVSSVDLDRSTGGWSPDGAAGRSRRSRAELRRLVTSAGVELFVRDGLGLKPETLTYSSVFAHIKQEQDIVVHRSTVHQRIWSSQDEFRLDVLAEAARSASDETFNKVMQVLAATPSACNADGSINRRQTLLDNVLAVIVALTRMASRSQSFARWQSIKASLLTQPDDVDVEVLRQAVRDRYSETLPRYASVFRVMFAKMDHRVDPSLHMSEDQALHLLAVLCATFLVGYEYNTSAGAEIANRSVPMPRVDGSGRTDDWPIMAVGVRAVIELLFVEGQR